MYVKSNQGKIRIFSVSRFLFCYNVFLSRYFYYKNKFGLCENQKKNVEIFFLVNRILFQVWVKNSAFPFNWFCYSRLFVLIFFFSSRVVTRVKIALTNARSFLHASKSPLYYWIFRFTLKLRDRSIEGFLMLYKLVMRLHFLTKFFEKVLLCKILNFYNFNTSGQYERKMFNNR